MNAVLSTPYRALKAGNPFFMQICVLLSVIGYAALAERFPLHAPVIAALFIAAPLTQYIGSRLAGVPFAPLTSLITACSLTLLLRTPEPGVAAVAAIIAVGSKFVIRAGGRHVFNPANLALATVPLFLPAWVSPGQWGQDVLFVFVLGCAGIIVSGGARRFDTGFFFLAGYAAFLFARALYLGDPFAIPLHSLQNGGLILFSFFMITDPKTTPDGAKGRCLFAAAVLAVTLILQFVFFVPAAFIYALCAVSAVRGVLMAAGADRRFLAKK